MFYDEKDSIEGKEWYVLSTILDPRYKLEFFSNDLLPVLIKVLQKHLNNTVKEEDSGLAEDVEENETDVSNHKNETNVFNDENETDVSTEVYVADVSIEKKESDHSVEERGTDVSIEEKDTNVPVQETNVSIDKKETNVPTSRNLWDYYNEIVEHGMFQERDPDFVKEVNEYLNSIVVPRHVCPLTWWRDNQNKFPDLASMARKYLAVPATCLSLQAKHCRVHDQMDYCQISKTSDKLMFLHYNLSLM